MTCQKRRNKMGIDTMGSLFFLAVLQFEVLKILLVMKKENAFKKNRDT